MDKPKHTERWVQQEEGRYENSTIELPQSEREGGREGGREFSIHVPLSNSVDKTQCLTCPLMQTNVSSYRTSIPLYLPVISALRLATFTEE